MIHQASDLILTHAACPIGMAEFKREFLALYEPPLASKATRAKLDQVLRLLEGLGIASTDQFTPETVARFISARPAGESPHTTRGLLIQLRVVFNYAEGRRYLIVSPFRLKKLARSIRVGPPAGKRHLSREDVRAIFAVLRKDVAEKLGWAQWRARRLLALIALIAYTGLRRNEALYLWVEDIDLAGRIVNLGPSESEPAGSLGRRRGARLKTEQSAHRSPCPRRWSRSWRIGLLIGSITRTASRCPRWTASPSSSPDRAGPHLVGGCHGPASHRPPPGGGATGRGRGRDASALRRTWATIAEAEGIPQALITRQCRHASEETTRRWYQQRDLAALKDAVRSFEILMPSEARTRWIRRLIARGLPPGDVAAASSAWAGRPSPCPLPAPIAVDHHARDGRRGPPAAVRWPHAAGDRRGDRRPFPGRASTAEGRAEARADVPAPGPGVPSRPGARKARRLAELGYEPGRIAELLDVNADQVAELLSRIGPDGRIAPAAAGPPRVGMDPGPCLSGRGRTGPRRGPRTGTGRPAAGDRPYLMRRLGDAPRATHRPVP